MQISLNSSWHWWIKYPHPWHWGEQGVRKLSLTTTWALFNQQFRALETPRRATRHCVMYVRSGVADGYFPHFFLLALSLALSPAKKRKKKKAARERERANLILCAPSSFIFLALCGFFHFFTSLIKLLLHASFVPSPRSSSSSRMPAGGGIYFAADATAAVLISNYLKLQISPSRIHTRQQTEFTQGFKLSAWFHFWRKNLLFLLYIILMKTQLFISLSFQDKVKYRSHCQNSDKLQN